jgi:hypothetical protein
MKFVPMASQRQGEHILASLGQQREVTRVDDGDMARPKHIVSQGYVRWSFSDAEAAYRCVGL